MKKIAVSLLLLVSVQYLKAAPANIDTSLVNESSMLNKPAPGFRLKDITGKTYSLQDLKGKIVVLNFWFIGCKPCVNEMPVLNAIKKGFDPSKVVFLALSPDKTGAVKSFLRNHPFDYTILPDANEVGKTYDVYAYPASMVIDVGGITRFIQIGGPDIGENLSSAINSALKSR
jgi:peroxiredoxin